MQYVQTESKVSMSIVIQSTMPVPLVSVRVRHRIPSSNIG